MKLLNLLAIAPLMMAMTAHAAQEPPVEKSEKKICRSDGPPTGSIMSAKRVCRTKAEWTAIDRANAVNNERFQADRDAQRTLSTR